MKYFFLLLLISFLAFVVSDEYCPFKKHLTIATYKNPLGEFPNLPVTQSSLLEVEILDLLTNTLNFTYDIKVTSDGKDRRPYYGYRMKNGTWTDAMGLIQRKEVDMCISFSPLSGERREIVDSSFPVIFDETSILIPYPKETWKITALAEPFSSNVWICILVSTIAIPFSLWIANRFEQPTVKYSKVKFTSSLLLYSFFVLIEMMLSRSAVHKSRSLSYRLICGSSLLASIVLGNIYSGIYTSILAVPRFQVAITSIEDVIANPNIKVHVFRGTPTDNYVMTSVDNTMSLIRDQFIRNPSQRLSNENYTGDIASIIKDNRVLLNPSSVNRGFIKESYKKNNNKCKVALAEKIVYSRMESIDYPKNSPLTKPIDRELLLLHQFGLIDYANKKSFRQRNGGGNAEKDPCLIKKGRNPETDTNKIMPMGFDSFSGAFLVIGLGFAVAFLALVVECAAAQIVMRRSSPIVI